MMITKLSYICAIYTKYQDEKNTIYLLVALTLCFVTNSYAQHKRLSI